MLKLSKSNRYISQIVCWTMYLALAVIGASAPDTSGPWKIDGAASVHAGYESNLFRRPAIMDTGITGPYSPVEADMLTRAAGRVKVGYTANERHRLSAGVLGDYTLFPNHLSADESQIEANVEYRFRPVPSLTMKLVGDGGFFHQLGVDENSDGVSLYKYWNYDAGARGNWQPSKALVVEAEYWFTFRNHIDDALDNIQHAMTLTVKPSIGKGRRTTITMQGEARFKNYFDLGSLNDSGKTRTDTTNNPYPLRKYQYYTGTLGIAHDFGVLTLRLEERPRSRIDAFQDYFTYFENKASAGFSIDLHKKTSIDADGGWRYRTYKVHTAARPGVNPLLVMRYFDLDIDASHKLTRRIALNAHYTLAKRMTNTGYRSFHTYRDYVDHAIVAGVKVMW
jgi:hypothetical protein